MNRAFRFTAVLIVLAASSLWALDGMVLQLNASQFSRGALRLRYLSDGETITLDNSSCFGPSFSPDGRKVAYSVNDSKIYIINIDGTGKTEVTSCGGSEVMVTWAGNGYLYWSQCDRKIYRVKTDGSSKGTVFTSSKNIHNVGVSQNGSRAAWTAPSWVLRVGNISTGDEREYGGGCQGSISPDGSLVTHNQGGHTRCIIRKFDGSEYRTIRAPEGTFNAHRWSHSSDDYCLYTIEGSNKAYVHNVDTDVATYVGAKGAIYDYYAQEIRADPSTPRIVLSPTSLQFTAEPDGAPSPAQAQVSINNATSGTTLDNVTLSGIPAWLTATVSGSANNQTIANSVDVSQVDGVGEHTATVTVRAANADPQTATYAVSFVVSGQEAYEGIPVALPGRIEAEDFDKGGEGVAYHDVDAANQGGAYRTNEGVDIEGCGDAGGGYNVGWIETGEWLEYSVSIAESGAYDFAFRVASAESGGTLHLEIDGGDISGAITVPGTGGWDTWTTISADGLSLDGGEYVVRLVVDQGGFNLNYIEAAQSVAIDPISVLQPQAGDVYEVGDTLTVAWNADCDRVPGVKIELSVDEGETFVVIEASGSLDCGEQVWKWMIPDSISDGGAGKRSPVSSGCLVRVSSYMGSEMTLSPLFSIEGQDAVFAGAGATNRLHGSPVTWHAERSGHIQLAVHTQGEHRIALVALNGHTAYRAVGKGTATYTIPLLSMGTYVITLETCGRLVTRTVHVAGL